MPLHGRIYTAAFAPTSQTATNDAWEFIAATLGMIGIRRVRLFQTSDVGDAEDEQILVTLKRGAGSTSGSGGTTVTPAPKDVGGVASSTLVEVRNTTIAVAGGGSLATVDLMVWKVIGEGLLWVPADGEEWIVEPGGEFVINVAAPADALVQGGRVEFEEWGT